MAFAVSEKSDRYILRVAAASYDGQFLRVCRGYFASQEDLFLFDAYTTGQQVMQALQSGPPYHALILDTALSDMDADQLYRQVMELPLAHRPQILLITPRSLDSQQAALPDSQCLQLLARAGVQAPDLPMLRNLLLDAAPERMQQSSISSASLIRMFTERGVEPSTSGCEYLLETVSLLLKSREKLAIRKDILQQVSERHSVSVKAVDSGIRRVISALDKKDLPSWRAFKERQPPRRGKFTAGTLLYAIKTDLLLQSAEPSPEGDLQSEQREILPV